MDKKEIFKKLLLNVIDNLDCGNSNLSDEECMIIVDQINKITNTQNKLSKYQACKYLGISRSTFDNMVRVGKIPKGRKEQGFKELFWLQKDLNLWKEQN